MQNCRVNAADLPIEAYTRGEIFQREKRTLFTASWMPIGAAAQLPGPGSFLTQIVGGWPLVVVRGEDGRLRAFQNVCRHQSMPVVEKPEGSCDRLRCRYHGWTYDLTGTLIEAPAPVAPPDGDLGRHRLPELALSEVAGLLFVRVATTGAPPPSLELGGTVFAAAIATDIQCNWKTVVEHLLGDAPADFVAPALLLCARGEFRLVRQVLPRAFARTRLADIVFASEGKTPPEQLDAVKRAAEADKRAAEQLQAQRAQGIVDESAPAEHFRAAVLAALAAEEPRGAA
jgi:nitrite reductase/ring-hydroxylating ferredoxin subunit